MITEVFAIHERDESIHSRECSEPQYYYLDGNTMVVKFNHRDSRDDSIFAYNLSNLVEGVSFVQKTLAHNLLPIDSLLLENGKLTIE